MKISIQDIWKSPVWSNVIAAAIFATLTYFLSKYQSLFDQEISVPLLVVLLVIMLLVICLPLAIIFLYRRGAVESKNISSKDWLYEIAQQIKDCHFARIYLREFLHPDQFKEEHREALLQFMSLLAERLQADADIRIIAYHRAKNECSGIDWLATKMPEEKYLKKISLIKNQPLSNSSSMYIFDSGIVLYNKREKNKHTYHIDNLNNSIIHFLINRGFETSQQELK